MLRSLLKRLAGKKRGEQLPRQGDSRGVSGSAGTGVRETARPRPSELIDIVDVPVSEAGIIDYEAELNRAQLEAVRTVDGAVLVIAGAGSGKTRTLVYRVARLVETGVNPERILLLTFTRKAAQEMLGRASRLLDQRCRRVSGGTFHSFANLTLRKYANLIGFNSNFTIIDQGDSADVINWVRTELGYHSSEKRFPQKKTLRKVISAATNKDASLRESLENEYPHYVELVGDVELIRREYGNYKRKKHIMDYDDLLVHLKTLLEQNPTVRAKLSSFYEYIMVDEYQDTNRLQAEICYLLSSEHQNIMVVGDDCQSIYSFRGANFRNIIDFPRVFPETKIITIERNYRSTQPILDLASAIIKHAREKYSKTLYTERTSTQKPVFIEAQEENHQSKFIVKKVLELREQGIPLDEIAVLFRAGWHSNDLEIELANHNVPFRKYGGLKFIETAHVKDVVAHLSIAFNPMDAVRWNRVLLLIEGIGPVTASKLIARIVDEQRGIPFLNQVGSSGYQYSQQLSGLGQVLEYVSREKIPVSEKTARIVEYYRPHLERKFDDYRRRYDDLESLIQIAGRYESLEAFLVDLSLEPPEVQRGPRGADGDKESLNLSTVHSAKGLEWHTVFVIHLVDGLFPSQWSLKSEEELEEERRLLYVAVTRAKDNLFLIKPEIQRSGRSYFEQSHKGISKVSRFLKEGEILTKYVEQRALMARPR